MTATRIYHRFDSLANWDSAIEGGAGKLAKGEIAVVNVESGSSSFAIGYIGINETPTAWSECPQVFLGYVITGAAEPIASGPVVYEIPATTPPAGSTLSYDSALDRWFVDAELLSLDAYPTADGTVIWDESAGKFVVGAAVSAVELDGGEYTV
jgi:hypothetical protein